MCSLVKRVAASEKPALESLTCSPGRETLTTDGGPGTRTNRDSKALAGDRRGQHSIRINDQWRICFIWTAEGPADVEIVDYH